MEAYTLAAQPRETGKQAARATRRANDVPCVLYGHGVDAVHFSVAELSLDKLIYTNQLHTVVVEMEGQSWPCILKQVDFHPVTDRPIHADFQALNEGETVTVTIPIRLEGTPKGQTEGGRTISTIRSLKVTCLPKYLVPQLVLDIRHLRIGKGIVVGDLAFEGLSFNDPATSRIVQVLPPKGGLVAGEDDEEEGAVAEEAAV